MAKLLMLLGVTLFLVGAWMMWGPKIPFLGKLPGDIIIRRDSFTLYFPVVTCLVISIVITLLMHWYNNRQ